MMSPPSSSSFVRATARRLVLAVLLLLLLGQAVARLVQYDNTQPMLDREGNIMDAHDGSVQRFHGRGPFYMHTVSYGLCKVRVCISPALELGRGLSSRRVLFDGE